MYIRAPVDYFRQRKNQRVGWVISIPQILVAYILVGMRSVSTSFENLRLMVGILLQRTCQFHDSRSDHSAALAFLYERHRAQVFLLPAFCQGHG